MKAFAAVYRPIPLDCVGCGGGTGPPPTGFYFVKAFTFILPDSLLLYMYQFPLSCLTEISYPIVQPAPEGSLISVFELVVCHACLQLIVQFDGVTSRVTW